ncbi:ankyrin repeat-containing domain protein [Aspergillus cavernicola]|uniref:Ankyrin repeat-containing domain protein n=1 Tax=Aspergillus cavernicola TaxID=176166 RepID=A0ABR4IXP0_9EURO
MPVNLFNLPDELIELIARNLSTPSLFSFSQVSQRCYGVAIPVLHSIHNHEQAGIIAHLAQNALEAKLLEMFNRPATMAAIRSNQDRKFDALVYCCGYGLQQAVQFLLQHGVSPAPVRTAANPSAPHIQRGWTSPLMAAVVENHRPVISLLLNAGVPVVGYSHRDTLRLLFSPRPDNVVSQELINLGLPINGTDDELNTLLHSVCALHCANDIEFLLENGLDPNLINIHRETPISSAIDSSPRNHRRALENVGVLLTRGQVNPNLLCSASSFPIHHATQYASSELVKLLLDSGANVNAQETTFGQTALASLRLNVADIAGILRLLLDREASFLTDAASTAILMREAIVKRWFSVLEVFFSLRPADLAMLGRAHLIFLAAAYLGRVDLLKQGIKVPGAAPSARMYGTTPLIEATRNFKHDAVDYLINEAKVTGFEHTDQYRRTALHWAVTRGSTPLIDLLLPHTTITGIPDTDGTRLIEAAILSDELEAFEVIAILDQYTSTTRPANLVVPLSDALALAMKHGKVLFVLSIINKLRQLNIKYLPTAAVCYHAIDRGYSTFALKLIEQGEGIEDAHLTVTPLMRACARGDIEIVKALINQEVNLDATTQDDDTALKLATAAGHLNVVKVLVANGANLELGGESTALTTAVENNRPEIVDFLFEQGAIWQPDILTEAAEVGHHHVIKILLVRGVPIDSSFRPRYRTALAIAAEYGYTHKECVRVLLKHGADANRGSQTRHTQAPLACAAAAGCVETVRMLLDAGAYPNPVEDLSNTPLILAATSDYQVVELLVSRGAEVNALNIHGHSAAYAAVTRNNFKALTVLIANGAQLQDELLHVCIGNNAVECAQILVDAGCNPLVVNAGGQTPMQMMVNIENDAMIKVLYSHKC